MMDFHALTWAGEVYILSTDDDGRIVTPLPGAPPQEPNQHQGAAPE